MIKAAGLVMVAPGAVSECDAAVCELSEWGAAKVRLAILSVTVRSQLGRADEDAPGASKLWNGDEDGESGGMSEGACCS